METKKNKRIMVKSKRKKHHSRPIDVNTTSNDIWGHSDAIVVPDQRIQLVNHVLGLKFPLQNE